MLGSVANIGQVRKNSINRTQLSSESRKLRKAVPFQTKLFLADHLSLRMPSRVAAAELKDLNPSIGPVRRLIKR